MIGWGKTLNLLHSEYGLDNVKIYTLKNVTFLIKDALKRRDDQRNFDVYYDAFLHDKMEKSRFNAEMVKLGAHHTVKDKPDEDVVADAERFAMRLST